MNDTVALRDEPVLKKYVFASAGIGRAVVNPAAVSSSVMGMHLTPPGTRLNGWEWQMSKIIREPLLRWKANFLKKETA
jgi:hypothetical protein